MFTLEIILGVLVKAALLLYIIKINILVNNIYMYIYIAWWNDLPPRGFWKEAVGLPIVFILYLLYTSISVYIYRYPYKCIYINIILLYLYIYTNLTEVLLTI